MIRTVVLPAMLGALCAAAPPGLAQQPAGVGWGPYDGWMWWMPFHGILWLALVVAVVVGVVALIRGVWRGSHHPPPGGRAALDLLDARYARGEIDRDEYLQRKKDLSGG